MSAQRGVSSILLIAIIVLLASMATFALRFVASAQGTAGAMMQTMKAQYGAEAGMDWLRYRLRAGQCQPSVNLTIPLSTGAIQATVTCTPAAAALQSDYAGVGPGPGANENVMTYRLVSTACWPDVAGACPNAALGANYVERQIRSVASCTLRTPPTPQLCTW